MVRVRTGQDVTIRKAWGCWCVCRRSPGSNQQEVLFRSYSEERVAEFLEGLLRKAGLDRRKGLRSFLR